MTSSSFPRIVRNVCICQQFRPEALNGAVNVFAQCVVSISDWLQQTDIDVTTWSPAVLASPALLSSKARAGANRTQVLLLPLVAHPVSFAIIVTRGLMWFTLKLSFAVS